MLNFEKNDVASVSPEKKKTKGNGFKNIGNPLSSKVTPHVAQI